MTHIAASANSRAMAGIPTLSYSTTLDALREEWLYTQARIQADSRAQPVASKLAGFDATVASAIKQEQSLRDAVTQADAQIDAADAVLDALVNQVDAALLGATSKDRTSALYQSFFGGLPPYAFKQPVLGPELDSVAAWPARLLASGNATLSGLSTAVQSAVTSGESAVTGSDKAQQALDDFRSTGPARQLVDALNAARGDAYGALLKLRHDNPQWNVPSGWAESFFQHASRGARQGTTVARAAAAVASLNQRLQKASAHLADLQNKEAARVKQRADKATATAAAKQAAETARAATKAATAARKKAQKKRG